ncbi:pyruvate ferredoxin oxidoreductase [Chloroflexota bacterium]
MIKVITGNEAAAYGAMLAQPAVITAYPITPASRIPEQLSEFYAEGKLKGKFINVESEMTALSYVTGACQTGVRVFTATSSQGLAWMHEGLHWASGSRLPIVMANVNRPLGAPYNLTCGQIDSLAQRDTSWMQMYCESTQEVLDSILQGYRIAESMYLPLMVCLDGVYLSYIAETVDIPDQELVDKYLPPYDPGGRARFGKEDARMVLSRHRTSPAPVPMQRGAQRSWTGNRYDLHKLELQCLDMADQADREFEAIFGRSYPLVEEYRCDGAEMVLVTIGSAVGTARLVIDELRDKGHKVGLIKLKMFRPFPLEKVRKALGGRKKIAVIERDISSGQCGIIYQEMKWALYNNTATNNPAVYGFVGGLGGEDITPELIEKAIMYTIENDPPNQEAIWLGLEKEDIDDYDRNTVKVF